MLPVSFNQRIEAFSHFIARQLLVYWRSGPYLLTADNKQFVSVAVTELKAGAKIIILARQHYQEFIKTYPIADLTELKSVLAQEYAENPHVLHLFDQSESNQTKVCTFVLDPAVLSTCPGWGYFPETMLLANASVISGHDENVWDCSELQGFFFYCRDGLSISQKQGPLCANVAMFALNNGLPEGLEVQTPSPAAYNSLLLSGLKNCLARGRSFGRWVVYRGSGSAFNLKKWSQLFTGLLVGYLLSVSLYMYLSIESRKSDIAALGDGVNQLLDSQNRQKSLADSFALFSQSQKGLQRTTPVWGIVQAMLENNVNLLSFSIENEKLTLRGSAQRATDVLAMLLTISDVSSAEFTAPVRNENGVEVFVISVSFRQDAVEGGIE
jgi:hypothetical protein